MRNLKRALSLTLASVMLLGMMVVGAGAVGFPDVDENDNVEAIEVLNAVEVILGYDNGDFGPDDLVTRAQMAVIMAKLLKLDYQYYEASCPFTDVPAWARGYVGACYANGITSGYSATTYGSDDGITPVQAASMMMRALGYFKYAEDYKDGFEVVTVRQGSQVGIFEGVGSSATASMTRNQVARMALNALESEMVTFTGTPGIEVNGVVVGYRAEYTQRTSTESKYQAIERRTSDVSGGNNLNRGQYYIQLGEELYDGKLTRRNTQDDFMRPSINWQYNGKDIGTYVDYDLLVVNGTYTDSVKYSELYDLLTYTTINENDLNRYVDGVDQDQNKEDFRRSNTATVGGRGALTEVFYDQEHEEITITTINTWLAKANSDYNKTNESLSLTVYTGSTKGSDPADNVTSGGKVNGTTIIVDSKEVDGIEAVEKDDYMLVYMSGKNVGSTVYSQYDVVNVFDTEIMSDTAVTKYSIDGNANGKKVVKELTAAGTDYKTNCKAFYDYGNVLDEYNTELLSNMSYNLYMDRYDNVIGVDLYEGAKNYVFITGYDRGASHISVKTADAAAIFTDGTVDVITVNVTDTNNNIKNAKTKAAADYAEYDQWGAVDASGDTNLNRWYTYTVNANGTYTLKPIKNFIYTSAAELSTPIPSNANPKTLNSANLFLDDSSALTSKGRVYGEDASIYITVETDDVDYTVSGDGVGITGVAGVYTGAQDVKIDLKPEYQGPVGKTVNYDKTKDGTSGNERIAQETIEEKDAYVYTIFDNNNYIIASIVMGEAQGAAANYVYVLGGAKNERVEKASDSRSSSGDIYYWEFDAVVDGVKTTLTVKEKYTKTLTSVLSPRHIQEVRYDGDYVVSLKDVKLDDTFYFAADGTVADNEDGTPKKIEDMKIYDVGNVDGTPWDGATNDVIGNNGNVHNTYLVDSTGAKVTDTARVSGTIYLQGRTLYVDDNGGNHDVGLALARDAKAVLIQPENREVEVNSCGSVAEALGRLSDRDTVTPNIQFKGRIVAVLDSAGVAQWVVIISDSNLVTGNNPIYSGTTGEDEFMINNTRVVVKVQGVNVKEVEATIDRTTGEVEIYVPTDLSLARITDAEAADALYEITVQINSGVVLKATYSRSTTGYYVYTVKDVFVNTEKNNVVVITVKAKGTTGGDGTVTPPAGEAIKTIALTVPTDVKAGDKDKKITVTTANVKGEYAIKAAAEGDEEVSFQITTTHAQGFAKNVTVTPAGWNVTVANAGDKTATVTGKVAIAKGDDITGDTTKAPGNVAVDTETDPKKPALTYYYAGIGADGAAATADPTAVAKALDAKITDKTVARVTIEADKSVKMYEQVDGSYVEITSYTAKVAPVYSVSLNGKVVTWGEKADDVTVATTYSNGTKLMTAKYSKTEPTTVVDRNGEVEVTIAEDNVVLQPGYKVTLGSGLTAANCVYSDKPINDDNAGSTLDNNGYIVDGLYLSLKGTAKDGTMAALSINGTMQGTEKVTGATEEVYPVTFNAATMAKSGVAALDEMSGYKLKFGSTTLPGLFKAASGVKIPEGYAGDWYVFEDDSPWAADTAITVSAAAIDNGQFLSTVDLSSLTDKADEKGVITLYSKKDFIEVKFSSGATYSVEYTGLDGKWATATTVDASKADDTKLVKSGTKFIVTIENETVTMAIGEGEAEDLKAEQEITISNAAGYTFAQKA